MAFCHIQPKKNLSGSLDSIIHFLKKSQELFKVFFKERIFFLLFWEFFGPSGSIRMLFEGVMTYFENSTEFSWLFPEIPKIREISWILEAGDSSDWLLNSQKSWTGKFAVYCNCRSFSEQFCIASWKCCVSNKPRNAWLFIAWQLPRCPFQPVPSRVLEDLDEEDLEELFDDAAEGSALEDNWGEAMEVNTVICLLSSSTLIQPTHPLFQIINLHPLLPLLQVIQASEALLPQERPSEDDLMKVRATRPTMTLASLVMESSTLQVGSTAFRLRSTIGQRLCHHLIRDSCSLVPTDSIPPAPLDSATPTNTDYSPLPLRDSRLPPLQR